MSLTREQILAARNLPREEVQVPEWGGSVFVRVMSGAERDAYESAMVAIRDKSGGDIDNARARLVVACVTDAEGTLIFKPEDAVELGKDNWLVLHRLAVIAQRLNKTSNAELEALKGN